MHSIPTFFAVKRLQSIRTKNDVYFCLLLINTYSYYRELNNELRVDLSNYLYHCHRNMNGKLGGITIIYSELTPHADFMPPCLPEQRLTKIP